MRASEQASQPFLVRWSERPWEDSARLYNKEGKERKNDWWALLKYDSKSVAWSRARKTRTGQAHKSSQIGRSSSWRGRESIQRPANSAFVCVRAAPTNHLASADRPTPVARPPTTLGNPHRAFLSGLLACCKSMWVRGVALMLR